MKLRILNCDQKTPEWYTARLGRVTGSRAAEMLAKVKSGESAGRRNLRVDLALEQALGKPVKTEGFQNADTLRGIEREPFALAAYEAALGVIVERTGFIACESIMAGCSLDGHVGTLVSPDGDMDGWIVEAKAPIAAIHLKYVRGAVVPSEYVAQCLHNMWVTGAPWCDFISWNAEVPADLQLYVKRMPRIEAEIAGYDSEVRRFLAEVSVEVASLKTMKVPDIAALVAA